MRLWKYKHGGSTTTRHTECPARALLLGRCPKGCPERNPYGNCAIADLVDHPRIEEKPTGERVFISSYYYLGIEETDWFKRLKAVCDFHGLQISVEVYPWNTVKTVSHIKISKPTVCRQ